MLVGMSVSRPLRSRQRAQPEEGLSRPPSGLHFVTRGARRGKKRLQLPPEDLKQTHSSRFLGSNRIISQSQTATISCPSERCHRSVGLIRSRYDLQARWAFPLHKYRTEVQFLNYNPQQTGEVIFYETVTLFSLFFHQDNKTLRRSRFRFSLQKCCESLCDFDAETACRAASRTWD